ncbi:MAG: cation:dicarboxylase symporter family transporter [Acidobacteria bacterium]|nr:cation:dicarboxylase symporter family transporter [Acidobacteriota bacterium]
MTLAARVLVGLALGLLLGGVLSAGEHAVTSPILAVLTPIGALFVNLIRMTAIPLVASMLIATLGAIAGADRLGRVTGRALGSATALLAVAALFSALVAAPIFSRLPGDRALLAMDRTPETTAESASFARWIVDLVPQNVVKAAADGAVLPIIVFSVLFGLALARLAEPVRRPLVAVAEGVAATMQAIVGWIMRVAPAGVFALAVPLAARLGASAAGAVLVYVGLVVALTIVAIAVLLYPAGILGSRMPVRRFAAYCAPGQAIGFASRSSLAALPAMIESAERAGLGPTGARFLLPLLASVFHVGAAIQQTVAVLFVARLSDVAIAPWAMVSVVAAVVLATYAVPSVPGGSIIALAPVFTVAGVPIEGIGLLLALDTIPDMFRTTANLTGAMALAAALDPPPRSAP